VASGCRTDAKKYDNPGPGPRGDEAVSSSGQGMSDITTRGVRVRVTSVYIPERSSPPESEFFFAYRVRISNEGTETVQLISRHWIITDSVGRVEEVKGPGVVGEQPVLGPGETFEYTSFCPLKTPIGSMHGTYQMVTANGDRFDAEIAPFSLAVPTALN
jgi:ApaG protein